MSDENGSKHCEQNQTIRDFFKNLNECLNKTPDEDCCQQMLEGAYCVLQNLDEIVPVSNFELQWRSFKEKIKEFADPSTLDFYTKEIEDRVNEVLAPARLER